MTSPNDRRQKADDRTRKLFRTWKGGEAALWEYSVSHKTLRIRVTLDDVSESLFIICGDCEHITGPTKWSDSSFELEHRVAKDGDINVVLRDEAHHFIVHCGGVGAKEVSHPAKR